MKKKINVGIIGKNFGFKVIYKAFKKNKKFNVVAFSSLRKPKNKIFNNLNIDFYPNWKTLIKSKLIDAIVIATPPVAQEKIVKYALKNNKHIFCEKPLTESLIKAKKLNKILKRKKRVANIVNYIFPEIEIWKKFKSKINNKILINKIKLSWNMKLNLKKNSWKSKHSQGGGVLNNYSCHAIYYLENLFGKIIFLNSKIHYKNRDLPYRLQASFCFFSGATAFADINLFSKKKPIHKLEIETSKFDYSLKSDINNIFNRFKLIIKSKKGKKSTILESGKLIKNDFRIQPTYNNSVKFSDCILKHTKAEPNFQSALRVHYVLDCLIKSAKEKKIYFLNK